MQDILGLGSYQHNCWLFLLPHFPYPTDHCILSHVLSQNCPQSAESGGFFPSPRILVFVVWTVRTAMS